jgi:hypothetical protein
MDLYTGGARGVGEKKERSTGVYIDYISSFLYF